MVVVKGENMPPTHWKMGRITKVTPGSDGLIRVAEIQTDTGIMKRPLSKICQLPVQASLVDENKKVKDKSKYYMKFKPTTTFFLVLLGLICAAVGKEIPNMSVNHSNSSWNVAPFESDPGLIFNPINNVKLINNEWTAICYFNLTTYKRELQVLNDQIDQLRDLCSQTTVVRDFCESTVNLATQRIHNMNDNNDLIHHVHSFPREKRQRRNKRVVAAMIAGAAIGAAVNHYLQSADIDECKKNIALMHENENHILELIKNHTSILETISNVMKNEDKRISSHFVSFNKDLNELRNSIRAFEHYPYLQNANSNLMHQVHMLTNNLVLQLTNFEHIQENLIDVFTDAGNGRLHPALIRPQQIEEQLNLIHLNLPKSSSLPIENRTELHAIYKIIKMQSIIADNEALFKLTIPLVNTQNFVLYKPVSVPILTNNKFLWINSSNELVLVDDQKKQFMPISSDGLKACKTMQSGLMCHIESPTYTYHAPSNCIIDVLRKNDSSECSFKVTNTYSDFVSLAPNTWLYFSNSSINATVSCGKASDNMSLIGCGIIHIDKKCSLVTASAFMSSYRRYNSTINSVISHIDRINIHNQTKTAIEFLASSNITHTDINFINDIANISKQVSTVKNQQFIHSLVSAHHIGIFSIIIVVIIVFVIYKKCSTVKINHNVCKV